MRLSPLKPSKPQPPVAANFFASFRITPTTLRAPSTTALSAFFAFNRSLNERLGILQKTSFPEVPPRAEYSLTPFGARLST